MEVLVTFTSIGIYVCIAIIIIGLYKPWIALWWLDKQNRRMVLTYYGCAIILLLTLKFLLNYFFTQAS